MQGILFPATSLALIFVSGGGGGLFCLLDLQRASCPLFTLNQRLAALAATVPVTTDHTGPPVSAQMDMPLTRLPTCTLAESVASTPFAGTTATSFTLAPYDPVSHPYLPLTTPLARKYSSVITYGVDLHRLNPFKTSGDFLCTRREPQIWTLCQIAGNKSITGCSCCPSSETH